LSLENTGTVDLTSPSIVDNLDSQFGSGVVLSVNAIMLDTTGVVTGTAPAGLNAAWMGTDGSNILDGSGTLAPGDSLTVTFEVVVDGTQLGANAPIMNQADGAGTDPSGMPIMDASDSGTDPNGDNPGEPGDTGGHDDPTPITIADVAVAKSVLGSPTALSNGNFSVTYQLVIENTGAVNLSNIQLTEDLEMEFGAGVFVGVITPPSIAVPPADAGSTPPTLTTWNGGLGGSAASTIFAGSDGLLVPGDAITVEFTVEIDPDANGTAATLDNTAEVSADDPSGNMIMDDSDSGTDPNSDNPGEPGDMGTSDDPTPLDIADIRTTKGVAGDPIDNGDGTWTLPFTLTLENTGTVDLTSPSIVDNLDSQFGAGVLLGVNSVTLDTTGVVTGTAPAGLNAAWMGTDGSNMLDGSGTLSSGDSLTITFNAVVDGATIGAASPLENQADGSGVDPSGMPVTDPSDSGTDPNGNNPGEPGDTGGEDDPTLIEIADVAVAKAVVGTPTPLANDNFSVTYELVIENTGTVDLTNIQLTEDLETEFGAGVFVGIITPPAITAGPADAGSTAPVLGTWDGGLGGSTNDGIFNGTTGTLVGGDSITVTFTVEIDPDANGMAATLENTAEVTADDPDGMMVMDDSDSGSDPTSDNPGEPGDMGTPDDPTPLDIPDIKTTKALSADPINNGDGTWTLPFTLTLENTGTVDLTAPSIVDNLDSQFGAGVLLSVNSVALDTTGVVAGTAPAVNGAWMGTDASNMLDGSGTLAPGDSVTITFNAIVDGTQLGANSPIENQADGSGMDPSGMPVTDLSDSGTDPNSDNPGEPGDTGGSDDATPIEIADIAVAKNVVGTPTALANGNFSVTYQLVVENIGTVNLDNVQLTEDLVAEFGPAFAGVITVPSITDGPTLTGSVAPTFTTWNGGLGGSSGTTIFDGTSGTLVPGDFITVEFTVEIDR